MDDLDKMKSLDAINRKHLEGYVRGLRLKQLKEKTIRTKLWRIYPFLQYLNFIDAKTVTREQLEDYIIERQNQCSPFTVQGDILEVKLFFRWLTPGREKDLFQNIKIKKPRRHLPVEQLITREDIIRLVDACDKPRDRALIMLMWDSGARIGELLSLNIGHVQFDRYGAVVIVTGKTGMRRLRLISSVPDLQTWINMHPLRADANAPLFVTSRRYGHEPRRMSARTVENRLKYVARKLGMTKPIHPHAIRHARLTDLTRSNGKKQGLSEMELRLVAGWEKNSAMPEVYIHLSGADVERKLLENAGFIDDTPDPADTALEPRQCPRCKALNAYDALFCAKCSMALVEEAARKVDESTEEAKQSEDYLQLLLQIKKDLGLS
ncbi:site-specific integrase [Methanoculleus sp. 7T]|jgi:site-specific recombinase XerD|uniref:site-specific integrase n=1 Tax=Methanoculleus sp. 7T TaxID=2937282 RepID=UPI0020BDD146|nr:site-specific integrase [Methanoculleus sp. 7T]MCK8517690.1 tyrosine-type recombinase/integrase [Methanoculleus sp. 7T]